MRSNPASVSDSGVWPAGLNTLPITTTIRLRSHRSLVPDSATGITGTPALIAKCAKPFLKGMSWPSAGP